MTILPPQIILEDCLETLAKLDSNMFDLALIDAPYFDYRTNYRKDKGDKLSQSLVQQDYREQLKVVEQCIRVLKEGCSFWFFTNWQEAWWFQERFHSFLRNEIIWNKGNWTAGDLEGSLATEYEVIFIGTKGKGWKYKGKRIPSIWEIDRVGTDRLHSTEKPVALYEKIINIATDEGALIFDPYLGSAASAIAAMKLKRNFLGIEIDKEYYKRGIERIEQFKKEHNVKF